MVESIPPIDALVPAKDFGRAKARLIPLLTPAERELLARAMFLDVLDALHETAGIRRIWVVSAAPEVLELAAVLGARPLPEPRFVHDLNAALEYARRTALAAAAPPRGLLVVPADLPSATGAAFGRLLNDLRGPAEEALIRICPAHDGGTNALLLCPGDLIPLRYGRASAQLHADEARLRGIRCESVSVAELTTDLDTPADVERWLAGEVTGRTAELLRRLVAP